MKDIELLARLVGFDTTSGLTTKPLFDMVCNLLDRPEIRIKRFDCGDGLENLWCEAGPECTAGEGVVLCGHVDTVPAEEPEWRTDPRTLVERDEKLYARGACDMKGFDAIAINLFAQLSTERPKNPIGLLLTHSEEIGTIGAGQFVSQWPSDRSFPRQVIVGEPTSLRPVRGHKGHLTIRLTVGGTPCHTGFPHEGTNAIEAATPLLESLRGLRETMVNERTEISALFPDVPFAVLTIARVHGGDAINVMPERCRIDLGVRLLPGQSADSFLPRCLAAVQAAGLVIGDAPAPGVVQCEVLNNTPAFGTPEDDPFLGVVQEVMGCTAAIGVGYGTDAGRLDLLGCHSVIFGPGDIAQAHRANEWMPMDEFSRTPGLLRTIIERSNTNRP